MPSPWLKCFEGVALYLALCLLSTLAGRGIICLLRLRPAERAEPLLAAVMTYLVWTVALGLTASSGVALRTAAPWLWTVSAALAIVGLLPPWPRWRTWVPSMILCAALPVLALAHPFRVGLTEYSETVSFDGFFYAASGQYAWEHGLNDYRNHRVVRPNPWMRLAVWEHGTRDRRNLNYIHQVGATWPGHRCIGMAMLAFLSPLVRAGDTIADAPLLHAWTLFCLAAAVLLFWTVRGQGWVFAFSATAFTVVAGWTVAPFWANQLDNGLALVYLPALAAIMELGPTTFRRKWLLLGMALAALWYTYPPLAPLVMTAVTVVALPHFWRERAAWTAWLRGGLLALGLAAVLWVPGGLASIAYQQVNLLATWDTSQLLPGIHEVTCYPSAFWGLGGETAATESSALSQVTAASFTILALIGGVRLVRRQEWGIPLCVLGVSLACIYSVVWLQFSYPFLKLFSLTWCCFMGLVVAGAAWVAERVRVLHYRSALITAMLLVGGECQYGTSLWDRKPVWRTRYSDLPLSVMYDLRRACRGLKHGQLMVAIDDWLPDLLATYYLRDNDFVLATPQSYLSCQPVALLRKRLPPVRVDGVRYLVCDRSPWSPALAENAERIWSCDACELWRLGRSTGAEPTVLRLVPAVGHQRNGTAEAFLVGKEQTAVYVLSSHAGETQVQLVCLPSSHLRSAECTLAITANKGYRKRVCLRKGDCCFSLPLVAGVNRIELSVVDRPRPGTPSASARLDLVYLHALRLSAVAAEPQLTQR